MARNVSAADLWFDVAAVRARSPLVLNIGTRDPYWVDSMKLALASATQRGIPSVLDPVGAGATPYRNQTLDALFAIGGIHADNAREVLHAGADSLVIVSALCAADDPCAAALYLRALCDEAFKGTRMNR